MNASEYNRKIRELKKLLTIQPLAKTEKNYKAIEDLIGELFKENPQEIFDLTYNTAKRYHEDTRVLNALLKQDGAEKYFKAKTTSNLYLVDRMFVLKCMTEGSGFSQEKVNTLLFNQNDPTVKSPRPNDLMNEELKYINKNFSKLDKRVVEQYIKSIGREGTGYSMDGDGNGYVNKNFVAISKKLGLDKEKPIDQAKRIYKNIFSANTNDVKSALSEAAEGKKVREVLNARDVHKRTPLMVAIDYGREDVVKEILESAAKAGCLMQILKVDGKAVADQTKGIYREDGSSERIAKLIASAEKEFLKAVENKLSKEAAKRVYQPTTFSSLADSFKSKASSMSSWSSPKITIPDEISKEFSANRERQNVDYKYVSEVVKPLFEPLTDKTKSNAGPTAKEVSDFLIKKSIAEVNKHKPKDGRDVEMKDVSAEFKTHLEKQVEKILEKPNLKDRDKAVDKVIKSAFGEVSKIGEEKFVRAKLSR